MNDSSGVKHERYKSAVVLNTRSTKVLKRVHRDRERVSSKTGDSGSGWEADELANKPLVLGLRETDHN